jgi:hypothetical protein
MRVTLLAAFAALAIGVLAQSGQAATPGASRAEAAPGHAIVSVDCVWKRRWIKRHVNADGVLVHGHWSRHRHKVCD